MDLIDFGVDHGKVLEREHVVLVRRVLLGSLVVDIRQELAPLVVGLQLIRICTCARHHSFSVVRVACVACAACAVGATNLSNSRRTRTGAAPTQSR
jgi:hypothetical protein